MKKKSEGEIALPKSELATSAGKLTGLFFPRHKLSLVKPVKIESTEDVIRSEDQEMFKKRMDEIY